MTCNFITLDSVKDEVITLANCLRSSLSTDTVMQDGFSLVTVKGVGVIVDQDLSFNSHIKLIPRSHLK